VLRDNRLVTNRKVDLQLGNDSSIATKVMSHRTMLSEGAAKPVSNASVASSLNMLSSQFYLG
jgi:hypothetical protein